MACCYYTVKKAQVAQTHKDEYCDKRVKNIFNRTVCTVLMILTISCWIIDAKVITNFLLSSIELLTDSEITFLSFPEVRIFTFQITGVILTLKAYKVLRPLPRPRQ